MINNAAAYGFLLGCAVTDFRTKKISRLWLAAFAAGGFLLLFFELAQGQGGIAGILEERIPAALPGMLLLLLSAVFRGQMGRGDGLALLVLGLYLPARQLLIMTVGAFFLSGAAAAALLVLRKAHRGTQLPFLPFLAASAAGMLFFGRS